MHERPIMVQMLGFRQIAVAQLFNRFFHRIERVNLAGENAEFGQFMEGFGQRRLIWPREIIILPGGKQAADRHAVQRQRAGFVHAQHRRRAERLDRRNAARQDLLLRNAPCAHR